MSPSESTGSGGDSKAQLLIIVMDMNPNQKLFLHDPTALTSVLDNLLCFANAHLMLHPSNALATLGSMASGSYFLYPPPDDPAADNEIRQLDGQYELFTLVETTVRSKFIELLQSEAGISSQTDSPLSGSLAMALSYINRRRKENMDLSARILVITASGDTASQYMNYMNVFFTAQKLDVLLDTCMLQIDSPLLQQGADITGGMYFNVPDNAALLQFLLWIFLPSAEMRPQLGLPSANKVDFRAACFCHRQLVDIGFVCSVCLSIFCKFSPICTTCQTIFRVPPPLMGGKKKKSHAHGSSSVLKRK
ncbi:general transcription factor IIH subunit 3 [Lepeophtheirus salmonis]|uniref:General transcription factor IIH subunit 3 n=1 Tax=Lepeophtheirus salmonis TaxID=72036 RepID=C1BSM5_LEPSM|nr:general transcription factor IIH subunit 3-like [Lepeophtheirus salmonis]ACO12028.1 General transcription factor IIH subunit 3 [Lepeophtheirus salmonis]ADD38789.1 General transcription factor IIH subunit 3 [Lepeophtheirus salmonis]